MVVLQCVCRVVALSLVLLGAFEVTTDILLSASRGHTVAEVLRESSISNGYVTDPNLSNISSLNSSAELFNSSVQTKNDNNISHDNESKQLATTTMTTTFPVLQPGDFVPVTSPACGPAKSLPQDPCCDGTACCQNGMARVLPKRNVTWTKDTEIVIVASNPSYSKYLRPPTRKARLSWITDQKQFPYVLCHFCSIEVEPMCSVKTNQGFEASAYLAFIVSNYHRLPRAVAFVHGHPWVQNSEFQQRGRTAQCTNWERILQVRSKLQKLEDIFVFLEGKTAFENRSSSNHFMENPSSNSFNSTWQTAFGIPFPPALDRFWFGMGPHFVVGRNKILSRPREVYVRMLEFASGTGNYTDDKLAFQQGHLGAGVWFMEYVWNIVLNEQESARDPQSADSLRCRLGWCHVTC